MSDEASKVSTNLEHQSANPAKDNATLQNPVRVEVIRDHRRWLKRCLPSGEILLDIRGTFKPRNPFKQSESFGKFEEIDLKEMDPTVDHVFKGRILKLTMLERPLVGMFTSISCIGEDKNGDATRIYLYNIPHDDNTAKMYGFGRQVAILNPYMRIAMDGNSGIRVDDPKTIVPYGEKVDMCGYCGKEYSAQKCGPCKRPYCTKECQVADWKKLDHKLVCKK